MNNGARAEEFRISVDLESSNGLKLPLRVHKHMCISQLKSSWKTLGTDSYYLRISNCSNEQWYCVIVDENANSFVKKITTMCTVYKKSTKRPHKSETQEEIHEKSIAHCESVRRGEYIWASQPNYETWQPTLWLYCWLILGMSRYCLWGGGILTIWTNTVN